MFELWLTSLLQMTTELWVCMNKNVCVLVRLCVCMTMGVHIYKWCLSVKDDYVSLLKGQSRSHHCTIKDRLIHKNETPRRHTSAARHTPRTPHIDTVKRRMKTWCLQGIRVYCTSNEPPASLHLVNNTLDCQITVAGFNTNQPARKINCHVRFSNKVQFPFYVAVKMYKFSFFPLSLSQQLRYIVLHLCLAAKFTLFRSHIVSWSLGTFNGVTGMDMK